jgi:triosephosphate isomerase
MRKRSRPFIIGNWKTTPATLKEGVAFVKGLEKKIVAMKKPGVHYYIAAPDIFIPHMLPFAKHGDIGVQNISGTVIGEETGLATPSMIASAGATFTILGHSEVRARGEDLHTLSQKVALSLKAKLLTILCIGERERDKEGAYLAYLEEELKLLLTPIERGLFSNLSIAYEPVWAIGAPQPATTEECFEVVIALRRALAALVGIEYAKKVSILYGGSVTKETALGFLHEGGVDGLLLGRASQDVTSFTTIVRAVYAA